MADVVVFYSGPLVTRQEAEKSGADRFFTGKPCYHGHIAERSINNKGSCVVCIVNARKKWRNKNKEAYLAGECRRKKLPHNRAKCNARRREKRKENLEDALASERKRSRIRYAEDSGVEHRIKYRARRDKRLAEAAGRPRPTTCDICNEKTKIVFDHCHKHGHFRGWLCDRCNWTLGHVKDSPSLLRKMAKYLERTSGATDDKEEEQPPLLRLLRAG